jgi:hypothetical protein
MKRKLLALGAFVAVAGSAVAQQGLQRRANMVGGGGPDYGKCTVEVVVDGGAQIEIRGDTATLRDTNGQTPQWRRFECTSPLPASAANFRFAGVDGRGNQTLVRDPRNGGAAVVQIADPQGGSEGYTFDLFWGNDRGPISQDRRGDQPYRDGGPPFDRAYRDGSPPFDRGGDRYGDRDGNRFTSEQAIRVCQDSIAAQANTRFRGQAVQMGRLSIDNNPGRNDWVLGDLAVRRRFGRQDMYRFNCSVNFATGQVRTVHIDQFPANLYTR